MLDYKNIILPGNQKIREIKETHISVILLSDDFAYKFKKPYKLSFLDFSTLAKRKFYCDEELRLNKRLAPSIYLNSSPLIMEGDEFFIGSGQGDIVDYCVTMRRMDNTKEMDRLLDNNKVGIEDIKTLAEKIAEFHRNLPPLKKTFSLKKLIRDYSDIRTIFPFLEKNNIQPGRVLEVADLAIKSNQILFRSRINNGWIRECHGDLHPGNIILEKDPLIFDCIEFNKDFREIDVIHEVAFLAMDLEFHKRPDLEKIFLETYLNQLPALNEDEKQLLYFYKSYCANIRLKVNVLKMKEDGVSFDAGIITRYFEVMQNNLKKSINKKGGHLAPL